MSTYNAWVELLPFLNCCWLSRVISNLFLFSLYRTLIFILWKLKFLEQKWNERKKKFKDEILFISKLVLSRKLVFSTTYFIENRFERCLEPYNGNKKHKIKTKITIFRSYSFKLEIKCFDQKFISKYFELFNLLW